MYCTYVLYSKRFDRLYIGYTSSLIERFRTHNELGTKGYTLRYRPWVVIHVEFFKGESEAIKREKALKGGQGRRYIRQEIMGHPEIGTFILNCND